MAVEELFVVVAEAAAAAAAANCCERPDGVVVVAEGLMLIMSSVAGPCTPLGVVGRQGSESAASSSQFIASAASVEPLLPWRDAPPLVLAWAVPPVIDPHDGTANPLPVVEAVDTVADDAAFQPPGAPTPRDSSCSDKLLGLVRGCGSPNAPNDDVNCCCC